MLKPTNQPGLFEHHPADPNHFSFDKDVAAIFDDMSRRSIPNFLAAHRAHAKMAERWVKQPGCKILDVGSSRGQFFRALREEYPETFPDLRLYAVDNSPEMCGYLKTEMPEVTVRTQDITAESFLSSVETYDIVCCNYTLQFIPANLQPLVLNRLCDAVAPGGILIFGHKASHEGELGELAHEQYIQFRIGNGYSREEIERKTAALKGSMFPASHQFVKDFVMNAGFNTLQETFRFMMFTTFVAGK